MAASIDSSMPQRAWTVRARSSLLAALIYILELQKFGFHMTIFETFAALYD